MGLLALTATLFLLWLVLLTVELFLLTKALKGAFREVESRIRRLEGSPEGPEEAQAEQ